MILRTETWSGGTQLSKLIRALQIFDYVSSYLRPKQYKTAFMKDTRYQITLLIPYTIIVYKFYFCLLQVYFTKLQTYWKWSLQDGHRKASEMKREMLVQFFYYYYFSSVGLALVFTELTHLVSCLSTFEIHVDVGLRAHNEANIREISIATY